MSDVQDLDQDVKVVEQPAPAEPTSNVKDPTGLRDAITKAVRAQNEKHKEPSAPVEQSPPVASPTGPKAPGVEGRDDKGRFAKPAEKPEEKPLEGAQPEAVKKDEAPGSWKAVAKAKWAALDPDVKADVLRRESELTREIGNHQKQIKQINEAYAPIEQLIGSRRALWNAQFGNVGNALNKLLSMSDLASQDPTAFLGMYLSDPNVAQRVDLQKVFGQAPQDGSANPQWQQTNQRLGGLEQRVNGWLQQQEQQALTSTQIQIAQFFEAKDQQGNLMRPHAESLREDIFNLVPSVRQTMPTASVDQVMQRAYDIATRTNDSVRQDVERQEQERIRAEVEKSQRAQRAATANKFAPATGPAPGSEYSVEGRPDPKNLRATLQYNLRMARNGEQPRV